MLLNDYLSRVTVTLLVVCILTMTHRPVAASNEFFITAPVAGLVISSRVTEIGCEGGRNPAMAECYTVTVEQCYTFAWGIVGDAVGSSNISGNWSNTVHLDGGLVPGNTTAVCIYGSDGVLDRFVQLTVY